MSAELCSTFSWEPTELMNQVAPLRNSGRVSKDAHSPMLRNRFYTKACLPGLNVELKVLQCQADERTSTLLHCLKL